MEYIVTGTDGGFRSEIWYVSTTFKNHFSGNLDMFKRIKSMFGVETKMGENNFYFIKGIGVVEVMSGSERIRIQSVLYTPDIDRNVLSLDQLITQGYTVKFIGDKCKIFPTFSILVINRRSDISGLTREDEIGLREKESLITFESDYEAFKTDYLHQYIESLNISSNEPDWNVLILQAMLFKEFHDCKALLDMLEDDGYVKKLEITTRPLPAYASDNRKVSLLELYMVVNREDGHRRITENNMWAMIAKDMGFDYNEGEFMRLMYAMYLDVLVYYYKFKSTQQKGLEKEVVKNVVDPRRSRSEGDDKSENVADQMEGDTRSEDVAGKEAEHYAFYAGNDC
ncbi:putative transcription factor & chromatin remodeling ARID family [Helianthus annuus]|nr:putative transcription factor & chromatin remodeling ARID family [Helianthus annuus]